MLEKRGGGERLTKKLKNLAEYYPTKLKTVPSYLRVNVSNKSRIDMLGKNLRVVIYITI